jgi:DDE superfamily endonuclease
VQNNLFCCPGKRVLFLSATDPGSVHDKAICDEEAYAFPDGIVLDQDAGYQGHQPQGVEVRQPAKKPRGRARTAEHQSQNQQRSRQRVVIKHAIGLCKRWRVVRDVFRGRAEEMRDTVMLLCCGLHNLLLTQKQPLTP